MGFIKQQAKEMNTPHTQAFAYAKGNKERTSLPEGSNLWKKPATGKVLSVDECLELLGVKSWVTT